LEIFLLKTTAVISFLLIQLFSSNIMADAVISFPSKSFSIVVDSINSITFWATDSMLRELNYNKIICTPRDSCENGCYALDSLRCRKSSGIDYIVYNCGPCQDKKNYSEMDSGQYCNFLNYVLFKDSLSVVKFCQKNGLRIRGACEFAVNGRFHLQKVEGGNWRSLRTILPLQLRHIFDKCRWVYTTV
jgi:hypothetical protein